MTTIPQGVAPVVAALTAANAARFLLLFDFDGTLAELALTPDAAVFPQTRRDALASLAARPDCSVGVVSGRRLADVRAKVGIAGEVYYAGLHGMEIEGGGASFLHEGVALGQPAVAQLREQVAMALADFPGVALEDKCYSFALHTRQAAPAVKAAALRTVSALAAPLEQRGAVRLQYGDEICEVLPNIAWNKGDALRWMQHRALAGATGALQVMYVGDDLTDEDAFRAVPPGGVSVVVGARPSVARHRLSDPTAVEALIRMLAAMPFRLR